MSEQRLMQEFRLLESNAKIVRTHCQVMGISKNSFFERCVVEKLSRDGKELKKEERDYIKKQKIYFNESEIQHDSNKLKLIMKKLFLPRSLLQRIGWLASTSMAMNNGKINNIEAIKHTISEFMKIEKKFPNKIRKMIKGDLEILKRMKNVDFLSEFISHRRFGLYDGRTGAKDNKYLNQMSEKGFPEIKALEDRRKDERKQG